MNGKGKSWIGFWDNETIISDKAIRKNMEIFVRGSSALLEYSNDDIVLDIGCGKGCLVPYLIEQVKEIHLIDTSL